MLYECHANRDEWQQKVTKTGESELVPFDQNLLIPVDLSRLRQIVIKLVSRLLTERLLVRVSSRVPTYFPIPQSVKQLSSTSILVILVAQVAQ